MAVLGSRRPAPYRLLQLLFNRQADTTHSILLACAAALQAAYGRLRYGQIYHKVGRGIETGLDGCVSLWSSQALTQSSSAP